jgi:CRISPR type IV-associated protein Csf3
MDSSDYTSLRLRAWLRTPVLADEWLPLDGAMLAERTRRDLGWRACSIPGASLLEQPKGEVMKGGKLPIATVHAKDWYYRCSWAQWGPHSDGQDRWAKRFDLSMAELIDFKGRRGRIDTSAATYKAYLMPVFYRAALWIEWFCVGDANELDDLSRSITHLGKKTAQGWGRVMRWEVEKTEEDWSIWQGERLMRGIPRYHWPNGRDIGKIGFYGIRPSYWDRRNQMELVLP